MSERTTSLTQLVVREIILFKEHEVCYWLQWGVWTSPKRQTKL